MRFFITGTAGFIGYHLANRLLGDGHVVTGFDGLTPYYDVDLKQRRHAMLAAEHPAFTAVVGQLEDAEQLTAAVADSRADVVVHLAAQAGVRYSIDHPETYIRSNLTGTANLLECMRTYRPKHLLFASTSSIYGGNRVPFAETDRADGPVSLYAATKKGGEAMMHAYSHLWQIPTTCFRFFTVYGPWGRPDMALFKFVAAIQSDKPIDVYGQGRMRRDFTYVDDLVEAVVRLIDQRPAQAAPGAVDCDSLSPVAPFRIVNIGGGKPVELMQFIEAIEHKMGRQAAKNMLPMQPGDVVETMSDPSLLRALVGDLPTTPLARGISCFVDWYLDYRGVSATV